jgi:hypothetical protein
MNIEPQELPHIVIGRRKMEEDMSSPTHNNFVQPYQHTNHKRSENFHPMHQTKKNSNLWKGDENCCKH